MAFLSDFPSGILLIILSITECGIPGGICSQYFIIVIITVRFIIRQLVTDPLAILIAGTEITPIGIPGDTVFTQGLIQPEIIIPITVPIVLQTCSMR